MTRYYFLSLLLVSSLLLTACVSREQADARLAKGCAAGAELYLDEGYSIQGIKNSRFKNDETGVGDRKVEVIVTESDGWAELENTYTCIFVENFGFLGNGYSADIVQIEINGEYYGKKDGQIMGSFNDWATLSNAVGNAIDNY